MRRWFTLGIVAASAVALAAAEKIEREQVLVMSGPGSFHARKGELRKGVAVEVLGEKGSWLKVKAGAVEGYIPKSALDAKGRGGLAALGGAAGSSAPTAGSETAGVKGFNPDVEKAHARERGQDWAFVAKLDQQRVSAAEVEAFVAKRGLAESR